MSCLTWSKFTYLNHRTGPSRRQRPWHSRLRRDHEPSERQAHAGQVWGTGCTQARVRFGEIRVIVGVLPIGNNLPPLLASPTAFRLVKCPLACVYIWTWTFLLALEQQGLVYILWREWRFIWCEESLTLWRSLLPELLQKETHVAEPPSCAVVWQLFLLPIIWFSLNLATSLMEIMNEGRWLLLSLFHRIQLSMLRHTFRASSERMVETQANTREQSAIT